MKWKENNKILINRSFFGSNNVKNNTGTFNSSCSSTEIYHVLLTHGQYDIVIIQYISYPKLSK